MKGLVGFGWKRVGTRLVVRSRSRLLNNVWQANFSSKQRKSLQSQNSSNSKISGFSHFDGKNESEVLSVGGGSKYGQNQYGQSQFGGSELQFGGSQFGGSKYSGNNKSTAKEYQSKRKKNRKLGSNELDIGSVSQYGGGSEYGGSQYGGNYGNNGIIPGFYTAAFAAAKQSAKESVDLFFNYVGTHNGGSSVIGPNSNNSFGTPPLPMGSGNYNMFDNQSYGGSKTRKSSKSSKKGDRLFYGNDNTSVKHSKKKSKYKQNSYNFDPNEDRISLNSYGGADKNATDNLHNNAFPINNDLQSNASRSSKSGNSKMSRFYMDGQSPKSLRLNSIYSNSNKSKDNKSQQSGGVYDEVYKNAPANAHENFSPISNITDITLNSGNNSAVNVNAKYVE